MSDTPMLPAVKRRPGRPRRERSISDKLLPTLAIDFTKDPAEQALPCSEREQAKHLNWYALEVRAANQTLGLYQSIPMICQASGCHWASQCPTNPEFMFKGRPCPLEIIQAYRLFVGYVREMNVQPDDAVDLGLIADLVRIQVQINRIDQQLQIHGMMVDSVGGIAQKDGKAIMEKAQHPLFQRQSQLRDDRNRIHKDLIASRAEKEKLKQAEGKQRMDALTMMQKMRELSEQARVTEVGPSRTPALDFIASPPLEGELVDPDPEPEEDEE